MRTVISYLALLSFVTSVHALEIPITVSEPVGSDRNEVVSGGIPLPKSQYKDPAGFSLSAGTNEIPVQLDPIRGADRYEDGSLHWALVSFPVELKGNESKTFTLRDKPGAAALEHPVTLTERGSKVILDNGLVGLTIDKENFNGLESVTCGSRQVFKPAKAGLTFDGKGGPAKPTHFEVRYGGPVRTTLYVKGVFGDLAVPTWSMAITLCAGQPAIHIDHQVRNGGIKAPNVDLKDAKLNLGLNGPMTAGESGRAGASWFFRRFGGPADLTVFMRHGGGGISGKKIEYDAQAGDSELAINLDFVNPGTLAEGCHKITEIDFVFGKADPAALASPLHALASTEHYASCDSMGVGWGFGSVADETAVYRKLGWAKPDDPKKIPHDRKAQPDLYRTWMDVHGTTEADQIRGLTVQYVRSGERGYLDRATSWQRHYRTRYLWRTDDFTFGKEGRRKVPKWGGDRWCDCHSYGQGLFNYALLTGNIDCLEAAFDAAEHANAVYGSRSKTKPGKNFSWWGSRSFARLYEIVARAYEVARTPEWREALTHFANVATRTGERDPRGFTNHGVMSTWTDKKAKELKRPFNGSPAALELYEKEGTKILKGGLCEHPKYGKWLPRVVGTWPEAMETMGNYLTARLLMDTDDPAARLAGEDAMDYAIAEAYFCDRYAFDPVQKCVYYYIWMDFPVPDYVPLWKGGKWDKQIFGITDSWYTKWWPNPMMAGYLLCGDTKLRDKTPELIWWGLSRVFTQKPKVPEGEAPPYAFISANTKGDWISTTALAFGHLARPRTDTTAPAAIDDLAVRPLGDGKAELSWTEPADAGGKVAFFQVKHDAKPIKDYKGVNYAEERLTVCYWNMASNVLGEPAPKGTGSRQTMTLDGIPAGSRSFAVRSFDDSHNRSDIGNVVTVEVK